LSPASEPPRSEAEQQKNARQDRTHEDNALRFGRPPTEGSYDPGGKERQEFDQEPSGNPKQTRYRLRIAN